MTTIGRLIGICALACLALSGCGETPRPFIHDQNDVPELTSSKAMIPLVVPEVEGAPGLSGALIKALEGEDLAATAQTSLPSFQTLRGIVDRGHMRLTWRMVEPNGTESNGFDVALAPTPSADPGWARTAAVVAARVAKLLRTDEASPLWIAPTISVGTLTLPPQFDQKALRKALEEALVRRGYQLAEKDGSFVLEGEIRLTELPEERVLVEVMWKVKDRNGKELGVIKQSNPVARQVILSNLPSILRPLAGGAVDGVRSLAK